MFTSSNFSVIQCMDCGEIIKIEPQQPFDLTDHKCPKKVVEEPKKEPTKRTVKRKPKE